VERDHAAGAHVFSDGTDEGGRIVLMDKHVAADGEIEGVPCVERLGFALEEFNVVMAGRVRAFARNREGFSATING
jgi:hypothetical protein